MYMEHLTLRLYLFPLKADAENRPIYLESSSPANTRYYKKFGFEAKKDITLTRGCSPVLLTAMVREPQPRNVTYQSCKFQGAEVKA